LVYESFYWTNIMPYSQNIFLGEGVLLSMKEENSSDKIELSTEHKLMLEVAKGDHFAMEEIVNMWKDSLFRFFDRSLKNSADAEDLTQRVFIRVYQSASRYQPRAKFSTYLFTVARHLLIDEIKKMNRQQVSLYDDDWLDGQGDTQKDNLNEWYEILNYGLKGMPEHYSTSLLLRVQRELSYVEIADIMKVSESRVKTWIHRARRHLKETLENYRN